MFFSYIANWDGFADSQSGLVSYSWCISSSTNYTCDTVPSSDPHGGQAMQYWTNTGLAKVYLSDGSYYVSVSAINGAGYGGSLVTTVHHSVPYIVDTTPPVIDSFELMSYDIQFDILNLSYTVKYVYILYWGIIWHNK